MRIDVADPGSERLAIVQALSAAGFEVRAIEIRDLPETRADLVVLAGDAKDALEALRTLRDDGARPDVPVVLVGTPEGTDPIASGPGFGAERVLGRPVDDVLLVEAVRLLIRPRDGDVSIVERVPELTLELAQRERAAAWRTSAGEDEPERDDPSGVSAIHPMSDLDPDSGPDVRQPEPVPGKERPSSPARRPSVPPPPTGVSVVERSVMRASEMPPTSTPAYSVSGMPGTGPGTGSDIVALAPISDQLRTLLSQADRRVFPSLTPLDVSIPAGEASALELVPDDFLDDAPLVEPEPEEETLFLPALPPSGWASAAGSLSGMTPSASPPSPRAAPEPEDAPAKKTSPGTPGTLSQRPPRPGPTLVTGGEPAEPRSISRRGELPVTLPDDASLGMPAADGTRRLTLGPGTLLRALVQLALHRATTRVEIWMPKSIDADVVLGFAEGELVSVDGPLHQEALALARSAAGVPAASSIGRQDGEEAARERLVGLIERRELSLPASAFIVAAAERTLLARTLTLSIGEARFRAANHRDAPPRLGRTGPLLLELAASLDAQVLTALAGKGALLAPSRAFASVCEVLEPKRELVVLFEGAPDGVTPVDLARASLVLPGLVGMVAALFAGGGLSALVREDDGAIDVRAAEQLVREHARRAEDADYFALLGVARDATDAAIAEAHAGRVAMLAALPLDALGLGALDASRRFAIEALDEANDALADARLRALYGAALTSALRSAH